MDLRALLVDAFADRPLAGNAAGVVPNAAELNDAQMQAIARELNASETAFVRPSTVADRRLRYFTPTTEVDLCGHATVAAHAHLFEDGVVDAGTHTVETNVGVLDIEIEPDGTVWMTQNVPTVRELDVDYDRLAGDLGIARSALDDISDDLPVAYASTGLPFLVVPVGFLSPLIDAAPDFSAIESLCEETDTIGVYAFTFDTLDQDATLHARAWVPLAGVPEDPVTGTASGAAGAYLEWFGALGTLPDEMTFEQGYAIDRGGQVLVSVGDGVRVGGTATVAFDGRLVVPALGDDEIIEA